MKLLRLIIAISILSLSTNCYASNESLIGILIKIYETASKVHDGLKKLSSEENSESTQVIPPDNFSRASNLTVEQRKDIVSNQEPSDEYKALKTKYGCEGMYNCFKAGKDEDEQLYLTEFNARKMSNKEFIKIYYSRPYAFLRNNITLSNATNQEKIGIEKYLQTQAELSNRKKRYHIAFKTHVYKVIELMRLPFSELRELKIHDTYQNKEFNLNPASNAFFIKAVHSGILTYERNHPELKTHCLWGIGGRPQYLSECDELLSIVMKDYIKNHHKLDIKLTNKEIEKIAYEIDPHESLK